MSLHSLMEVNSREDQGSITVGEKLIIPTPARPQQLQGKLVRYRVRRGDTLETIAEQFSVGVIDLKRWNGMRGTKVSRGMTLRVYPGGLSTGRSASKVRPEITNQKDAGSSTLGTNRTRPFVHRVKEGETLWSIARIYQTKIDALRSANRFLAARQLQIGDQLLIMPTQ